MTDSKPEEHAPRIQMHPPLDSSLSYFAPDFSGMTRRQLLASSAVAVGATYAASQFSSQGRAYAAPSSTGTKADLKHVVIFMQENRSFDHYYGSLTNVRGFGDKQVLEYPDGTNIFHQKCPPGTIYPPGVYAPFHFDTAKFDAQNADGLDHSWAGTHHARNTGAWDQWVPAKKPQTMGYFTHEDIPFHYALASYYTICDHYFSSLLGPTTPNRLYQWTGQIDPGAKAGGPVTSNPGNYFPRYHWTTYPELLQKKGISWKVYANDEVGDSNKAPYVGDYGDNPLWLFSQYHDALHSSDPAIRSLAVNGGLHDGWKPDSKKGLDTAHLLRDFIADCKHGTLPKVSYVVAPYGWSEHPKASPDYGAHYAQTIINAIYSNPDIAASTALIINYDENDGYFDHLLPPTPESEYTDEFVDHTPIGYGVRVPLVIVSPWTRGGWVLSDVSDHTSIIRFLEEFTGVKCPNISSWRRMISSNLMSAFDFAHPDYTIPPLPDTEKLVKAADADRHKPALPAPKPGKVAPIAFDSRVLRHRPGQYKVDANFKRDPVGIEFVNHAPRAVGLSIYPNIELPFKVIPCTLKAGSASSPLHKIWNWPGSINYDFSVYGPDGFLRRFKGVRGKEPVEVTTQRVANGLRITLHNLLNDELTVYLNAVDYTIRDHEETLHGGATVDFVWPVDVNGFFDVKVSAANDTFMQRFAGRL